MTSGQIASRRVELCGQGQFEPAGGRCRPVSGRPLGSQSRASDFSNAACSRLSIVARSDDDVAKLVRAIHRKMRIRCLRPDMH